MAIEPQFYPIVFLRGWASTDEEIRKANSEPFHGFEEGSTRRRQGFYSNEQPFFFESVVVRLMQDFGYESSFRNNTYGFDGKSAIELKSLWVSRYYDLADKDYGDGKREPIEQYALKLRQDILKIRDKLSPQWPDKKPFKVHLVAHSMGGLVARCYLQNICQHWSGKPPYDSLLELDRDSIENHVEKLFTYGTPHNGIDLFHFLNSPLRTKTWGLQTGAFNRKVMSGYLQCPEERVNDLGKTFLPKDLFCLIGTDYRDYDIAISSWATGKAGDGLVLCKNAFTRGSPRAYVHRAHGGPYGMVNSQEGYENLTRFLFGDWRVDFELFLEAIALPKAITERLAEGNSIEGTYLLDSRVAIRDVSVVLHERKVDTDSAATYAIDLQWDGTKGPQPVIEKGDQEQRTIASIFLISTKSRESSRNTTAIEGKDSGSGPMVFSLSLALEAGQFGIKTGPGTFPLFDLPGFKLFSEDFRFRLNPETGRLKYSVASTDGAGDPVHEIASGDRIPFGKQSDQQLHEGQAVGFLVAKIIKTIRLD